ncbi:MAG: DUF4926 domain-containing protein [Pseudomonadota bacterium]
MSPTHKQLDSVVLTVEKPDAGLRAGDIGSVVEVHGAGAYEVEFVAASGRTQALLTLTAAELRAVEDTDLLSVRSVVEAAG